MCELFPSTNQLPTRVMFSTALRKAFQKLNMYPHHFNTHSFRIGAATSPKKAGISDSHLKVLGRRKSNAYLKYVRLSPQRALSHQPLHAVSFPLLLLYDC